MDSAGHLHGKPTLRRVAVKSDNRIREQEQENWEELEPVTPAGRLFNQPSLNCYILVIFGFKTQMDVEALKAGLEATLIKHKRFSSIVKEDKRGVLKWMPVDVNIDDHVLVPFIDPDDNCNRNFVEQYTAKLATAPPLHPSRPLWQIHLLRVRSEEAASSLVIRVHHSLGDGVSLMSLLLACTRKASDSQSLPTIPRHTSTRPNNGRGRLRVLFLIMTLYNLFLVIWYTTVDITLFLATIVWIKDSKTPIKGYPGVESSPKQIEYATLSLEDFKIVRTAVNGTINDVMLGMTSAGILRYLEREYEAKAEGISKSEKRNIGDKQSLPSNLRVRSAILVNTRPPPKPLRISQVAACRVAVNYPVSVHCTYKKNVSLHVYNAWKQFPGRISLWSYAKGNLCTASSVTASDTGLEESKESGVIINDRQITVESREDGKIHVRVDVTGKDTQKTFDHILKQQHSFNQSLNKQVYTRN